MWLSRQGRGNGNAEAGAELGTVTLAGDRPSVYLSGERRDLPLMGPGGYLWRPAPGQRVLVIKAGDQGEELCIAGVETETAAGLDPGEILLLGPGGNTAVRLGADGRVSITGRVSINGVELPGTYQPQASSGDGS